MVRIAVLHPGSMGAAIGAALAEVGHDVGWLPAGRSGATSARADAVPLRRLNDLRGVEVVISLVPPVAAVPTASGIAGFAGTFVDANAISPSRAAQVAMTIGAAGGTYVDGGVVGPPPLMAGTTRLFLSGAGASAVADLFDSSRVDAIVLAGSEFAASAMKMSYATMTKVSAALLLATFDVARAHGVEKALLTEWRRSQPQMEAALARAQSDATTKGWRWADEMRQIAATFADVGKPVGFGEAAALVFDEHGRPV